MKLNSIEIDNFKSIEYVKIELKKINNNSTFCLFGINESGKSNILKAISLFDDKGELAYPEDYFDELKPVQVTFHYSIDQSDLKSLQDELVEDKRCPKDFFNKVNPTSVEICVEYENNVGKQKTFFEIIKFKSKIIKGYWGNNGVITQKENDDEEDLEIGDFFDTHFQDYFYELSHLVVFWESDSKYLILDDIDLTTFAANPNTVSIPLHNCFKLAGIKTEKIQTRITNLTSHTRIRNLESLLGRKVTEHINDVWKNHPISILFEIDSNKISLLIEDKDVQDKAKTTSQRSDGFKQFISFLLTISADDKTQSLNNKFLLIDEPETHLHPQAQINLKKELIKITQNQNSTFVIYATHSNYLIDKKNLNRNFEVFKENNTKTSIRQIEKTSSTYSEVNFEVFDIPTTDYHNELYGYLEEVSNEKLDGLAKDKV